MPDHHESRKTPTHSHGSHTHEHRETGHSHESMHGPGEFTLRELTSPARNFSERAFTVGIGGPVGSGKTALLLALCTSMRDEYSIGVVTNDIFTREDAEFLIHNNTLGEERIVAVETGGCPHAALAMTSA